MPNPENTTRRHIIGEWWCDAGDPSCFHNPPECGHPGCQGTKRGTDRREPRVTFLYTNDRRARFPGEPIIYRDRRAAK